MRLDAEREKIVDRLAAGAEDQQLAAEFGWPVAEIAKTRDDYFSRTSLATHYLRSRSLVLAQRVVRDASVDEALDVLSRPNIGVLEPLAKSGPVRAGFFMSTKPESLGGVQMAAVVEVGGAARELTADRRPPILIGSSPTASVKGVIDHATRPRRALPREDSGREKHPPRV